MKPYIVRQGEYLAKIAFEQGFEAEEVWGHEKNKALRNSGRTPEMLWPGDLLAVPERRDTPCTIGLGHDNAFCGNAPTMTTTVTFSDLGSPLANEPCIVYRSGDEERLTTTASGTLEVRITVMDQFLDIYIPRLDRYYQIEIGFLDPITTTSGISQRLANLGFDVRTDAADSGEVCDALTRFQVANGLPPTGVADEATNRSLVTKHGT